LSELGRRVVVALIGAPLAVGIIWFGDAALATLAAALSAIGAWEFYRIARGAGAQPLSGVGIVLSALIPLAVHGQTLGVLRIPLVLPMLLVLAVFALTIWLRGVDGGPVASVSTTLFGVLYTGGALSFVYGLRYHRFAIGDTAGALLVLLPLILTWSSDTGAYFAGRAIGGRKLMPSVSPGKTVAGAIGGVVLTVVVAAVFVPMVLTPRAQLAFSPIGLLIFASIVSVVAQIGDLAESLIKREGGVKDSGSIFPGHGGVLDRLDSLFFVLPVVYALYDLLLLPAPGAS
jgi:phosphatidate cytidylyltransferase